jgi:hypothetical protein
MPTIPLGARRFAEDAGSGVDRKAQDGLLELANRADVLTQFWQRAEAKCAVIALWSLYDAAYLELARRRGLPLATLDDELGAAAAALGLRLLGRDYHACTGLVDGLRSDVESKSALGGPNTARGTPE